MTTISYSKPDVFVIKQYTDDEKETNQMYDESEYAKDNEIAANRLRTLIDGIQPKQTAKDLLDDIFPDNCIVLENQDLASGFQHAPISGVDSLSDADCSSQCTAQNSCTAWGSPCLRAAPRALPLRLASQRT